MRASIHQTIERRICVLYLKKNRFLNFNCTLIPQCQFRTFKMIKTWLSVNENSKCDGNGSNKFILRTFLPLVPMVIMYLAWFPSLLLGNRYIHQDDKAISHHGWLQDWRSEKMWAILLNWGNPHFIVINHAGQWEWI